VDEKKLGYYLFIQHIQNCTTRLVQLGMSTVCKDKLLTAATDVTKKSVRFIIVYCIFTVGSVKSLQYFCWGGIDSVGFVRRGYERKL